MSFLVLLAAAVPNPPPSPPPGLESFGSDVISWFKYAGIIAGVVGLMCCGIMMAIGRRNRSMTAVDGASGIPWVIGGLSVISFAAAIVGRLLS